MGGPNITAGYHGWSQFSHSGRATAAGSAVFSKSLSWFSKAHTFTGPATAGICNLLDKAYTDEGALQDASREGLQSPPTLPAALVDKLLKAFGQSGHLQTLVADKTARKYEPVEDEISLAGIVDMLLWHIWRRAEEEHQVYTSCAEAGLRPFHTNGTYQKGAARVVHSTMVNKL
ncbi:hypothetical protein WJX82_009980 [Trebouxia sp. C0006]